MFDPQSPKWRINSLMYIDNEAPTQHPDYGKWYTLAKYFCKFDTRDSDKFYNFWLWPIKTWIWYGYLWWLRETLLKLDYTGQISLKVGQRIKFRDLYAPRRPD